MVLSPLSHTSQGFIWILKNLLSIVYWRGRTQKPFYWDRKNREIHLWGLRVKCLVASLKLFSSLIQISPHFKLLSIKNSRSSGTICGGSLQVLKLCLRWALIILVVSVFGLMSLHSTGYQLPFGFLTCLELFPEYWSFFCFEASDKATVSQTRNNYPIQSWHRRPDRV